MSIDVTNLHTRRASNRWERTSVGDMFERVTWSRPDHEALVAAQDACTTPARARLTYAQANDLVNQIANRLLELGLERGDRIMMGVDNSVEGFLFKIGIAKAGLVAVPLNPNMATDVVQHAIRLTEPRFSVVDAELWPRFADAFAAEGLAPGVAIAFGDKLPGAAVWFDDFIAEASALEPEVEIHSDDIWQMLFTSGTTAMPKASMTSHMSSYMAGWTYAMSLSRGVRHENQMKVCSFLPMLYHVAGDAFTFPPLLSGGTLVLGRRFDPALIARTVTRERATAMWGGAPAMLRQVIAAFDADPINTSGSSVEVIAHGWGSLPPGVAADLRRVCSDTVRMFTLFGQTEAVSAARFWAHRDPVTFAKNSPAVNYVGRPNPMLAERIVDVLGEQITDPRVPGEAVLRSPVVTSGYYRDPGATRKAFAGDWFHTGDSVMYDEDGLLIMVDRLKDIVKSGGENVSSQRVESILLQHPAVERAAVVGLPHPQWGEAVTGLVILAPGATVTDTELIDHCRTRLAGFETPKRVVAVTELPETVGAKVLKYRLRQDWADLYVTTP